MCGLASIARLDGADLSPEADHILSKMTRVLAHRGPDERELLREGPVGLGFTRLSLVDPAGGRQPLVSPDGSVVLIANGEVYNHRALASGLPAGTRLHTGSDCEVLLHLYQRDGLGFLDNVRGMFGLILWDRARNRLVLARDRFGVKPLFYHRNRERIVIASEIKALFTDPGTPRSLDWNAALADQALSGGAYFETAPPTTWFAGIESVPAGTLLTIDLADGRTASHRYWELPSFGGLADGDAPSDSEYGERFRDLLAESVAECATSDAGLGVFLSGGVDSAAVAALAARTVPSLPTFTVLTGSTVVNGDAEYAHRFAQSVGLPNHQVLIGSSRHPDLEEWRRLLWLTETPQCGPEQFYKHELHRSVRAHHPEIKGMLLGAAADEYTGGYTTTFAPGGWGSFLETVGQLATRQALHSRPGLSPWWDSARPSVIRPEMLGGKLADPYAEFVRWKMRDVQQYNCWHEDRTAAGSGIEARVPFLDHRLVELVSSIPANRRAGLLWDKQIIRGAVGELLPSWISKRPKGPFYHGEGVRHANRMVRGVLTSNGPGGVDVVEMACATARAREFLDPVRLRDAIDTLSREPWCRHPEAVLRAVNLGLLDGMLSDLPAPHVEAPVAPLPSVVEIKDWDADRERVEQLTIRDPDLNSNAVLRRSADTLLLKDAGRAGTWYLARAGSIEYEIEQDTHAHWLRLLAALDGRRALSDVLADADCSWEQVLPLLEESLHAGLLELVGATA
ncbi:asparagine synthase (glutamine-hydrolyzing) [Streptomyces sp. NPDC046994]|uniref:asparagine synthase (glutamine-hydrolyzing) n=1 Tax=Streptomyces sp. NPDC046994 TaxID=3155735 RepID=UPI0034551C4A